MPLADTLKRLDFHKPTTAHSSGLVSVGSVRTSDRADEGAIIREVAATFGDAVNHVYFRRFDDRRASQPLALVIDNANERVTADTIARVHRRLWWSGIAPLLYVGWPTRVDVFASARGPDFWDGDREEYKPWARLDVAGEVAAALGGVHRLSALRLADGTFWDDPENAQSVSHRDSAAGQLVRAIVEIDSELNGKENLGLRRLLLFTILIKYLDDRRVFPPRWFARFSPGAMTFHDVLCAADPETLARLLSALHKRFNGDVFAGTEAVAKLTSRQIRKLADLVEGKSDGNQRLLWAQYSFEHLPVEVVSSVYEHFVVGSTAVYTPPFLASFMLDRVLPFGKIDGTETVLDPACGSGVFLVGAFKRLIVAWRARNGWQRPNVDTLKGILSRSIFGVEIDPFAAQLTMFSLCLALCDALRPDVIWRDLQFDRLGGGNIKIADFFSVEHRPVDVVIGNPPFESRLSTAGAECDREARSNRGALPDKQVAYLVLEQSFKHLTRRGRVCLLQPHGLIYNRKSEAFRAHLLESRTINEVLDFVSIRGLYEGADTKTIAIVGRATKPRAGVTTLHILFRRTTSARQQIALEVDHYERHQSRQDSITAGWWRANLLGGGRLSSVATRFAEMQSLVDFIRKQDGWTFGEGYIAADGNQTAPYLTGQPFLPTAALTEGGIDHNAIGVVEETTFRRPRTASLYAAPLIVIREHESLPMDFVPEGRLAFRHKIIGIAAPKSDHDRLSATYQRLLEHRRLFRFLCTLRGSQALTGRATAILKSDLDQLPFPDHDGDMEMAAWEEILQDDVLEYMADYVRLGQDSEVMTRPPEDAELTAYASTFTRMLGTVYPNLEASEYARVGGVVCQTFQFSTHKPGMRDVPAIDNIREVLFTREGARLSTVRVLRYYNDNVLMIAKPDRLRYWLRSTAIRDADETLVDLVGQGY